MYIKVDAENCRKRRKKGRKKNSPNYPFFEAMYVEKEDKKDGDDR
jgi:hypothetical protein